MMMRERREGSRARSVSFSGIDGAGKSTQIRTLCAHLERKGLQVTVIAFWEHVARLTRIREGAGQRVFKGDKGVGVPSAPINRRDKNVQSSLMTCVRLCIYFLDALSARLAMQKVLRSGADFVIFDRYIYDELANLNLRNPLIRVYVRFIMMLIPRPQISFLLDADPTHARARKPEYPLDFLLANRQSYRDLHDLIGGMTIIAPMPLQAVEQEVLKHALNEPYSGETTREVDGSLEPRKLTGKTAKLDRPQTRPAALCSTSSQKHICS